MEFPQRQTLPHEVPPWVDPQKAIYFITINCRECCRNQLALPDLAKSLLATVGHRQEKLEWWPYLFLLMPDHVHALLSFPPSHKPLQRVISQWKEWTAKQLDINWQRDFLNIGCDTTKAVVRKRITFCKILFASSWSRGRKNGRMCILAAANHRSLTGRDSAQRYRDGGVIARR